jgi:hypothetical protein
VAEGEIPVLHDESRTERNGAVEAKAILRSTSDGKTRGVREKVAKVGKMQDKKLEKGCGIYG